MLCVCVSCSVQLFATPRTVAQRLLCPWDFPAPGKPPAAPDTAMFFSFITVSAGRPFPWPAPTPALIQVWLWSLHTFHFTTYTQQITIRTSSWTSWRRDFLIHESLSPFSVPFELPAEFCIPSPLKFSYQAMSQNVSISLNLVIKTAPGLVSVPWVDLSQFLRGYTSSKLPPLSVWFLILSHYCLTNTFFSPWK